MPRGPRAARSRGGRPGARKSRSAVPDARAESPSGVDRQVRHGEPLQLRFLVTAAGHAPAGQHPRRDSSAGPRARGRHPGGVRHGAGRRARQGGDLAPAAPLPAGHHGPRPHRDGRRQRRRRRGHLRPGRAGLRHPPALGPRPAHPRADRQPGDGRQARRGHRRRARPADPREVRAVLGRVLRRRPRARQRAHDRDRVHRRRAGRRVLRRAPVAERRGRRRAARRVHRHRQLPALVPLFALTHPKPLQMARDFAVPGFGGHGLTGGVLLLVIAIVGTTVAPWQLFFQQSNVVDKRITPRWISYERADTVIGSFVVVIGAAMLIAVAAFGLGGTALHGHFTDAGAVAAGLGRFAGVHAGQLFALVLVDASLIGAAAVTLATSYALGDIAGAHHSLHRGLRDAPVFYGCYAFFLAAAGAVVLVPGAPLGLITEGVQALAGVLLPSATVFLVLLCNDRDVLGPWVNRPWLNAAAGVIIGVLVLLSLVLTAATLFPGLSGTSLAWMLAAGAAAGVAGATGWAVARWRAARRAARAMPEDPEAGLDTGVVLEAERLTWRMPPLDELPRPVWSPGRRLGMLTLRCYLVVAVGLVVVKIVELSAH